MSKKTQLPLFLSEQEQAPKAYIIHDYKDYLPKDMPEYALAEEDKSTLSPWWEFDQYRSWE